MSIEEQLPAFAAGELEGEQQEAMLQALNASPRLWDEVARYQQLRLLLAAAAADPVTLPADLSGRIARQVAISFYLKSATRLIGDLIGTYGRAFAFYAGLS